jgi:ferritin
MGAEVSLCTCLLFYISKSIVLYMSISVTILTPEHVIRSAFPNTSHFLNMFQETYRAQHKQRIMHYMKARGNAIPVRGRGGP